MAKQNNPTLISVLRTAGQEVTGERLAGAHVKATERHFAAVRTAYSDASVSRSGRRTAQMAGMGGGNITTAPNFYSPALTPSSMQIPNDRNGEYWWAEYWFKNEPKVSAGINFYTHFPVSGYDLVCPSSYVKNFFDKLLKKLNILSWFRTISQEYHLRGDVFVVASIDCKHCNATNEDEHGNRCEHKGAQWASIYVLPPDSVEIIKGVMGLPDTFLYTPTEAEFKVVESRSPKDQYDAIPDKVKKLILARQSIKLENEAIWHFKRSSAPWQPYGTSMIRSLFPTLAYKDKLRQAQWLVAERHIVPIKVVKVGSETQRASEEDLQSVQEELAAVANDPILTLVTHHAFEFEYVGASGKVLQLTNEYELIDQEIIDGLMLNKAILNGDGPSYSNAQVGLLTMAERLKSWQEELSYWLEERIMKPVSKWNGFSLEGDRGEDDPIYPTVKWNDLQLRDDTGKLQMMVTANQNGVISNRRVIEAFGIDYDEEVEYLRFEQSANMVNSPGVMGSDMSSGFGGGGGYGGLNAAGGGAGGGGMPGGMPGGAPGGAPSGAPPGGGMPGGAPSGAPPGGMGGEMGMTASVSPEQIYRYAASISNDIYRSRILPHNENVNLRFANKDYKSIDHMRFVESMSPVSGRAYAGQLPDELEGMISMIDSGPSNGGPDCSPINMPAIWEFQRLGLNNQANMVRWAAGKKQDDKPQPRMFTSLEMKLYKIILGMNLPYAFYAQYQAVPGLRFQLDGALPALHIGIEADSETFHSSPEKIAEDKQRDMELMTQGWTILRFTEQEISDHQHEVVSVIMDTIRRQAGGSGAGNLKPAL